MNPITYYPNISPESVWDIEQQNIREIQDVIFDLISMGMDSEVNTVNTKTINEMMNLKLFEQFELIKQLCDRAQHLLTLEEQSHD
jgi:hypothetical protein